MKRFAVRHRKSTALPIAWREAEYAALQTNAAGKYDDRAGEEIFDVEDERTEIDIIMKRINHYAN